MNVVSLIITKFFNFILLPFGEHHSLGLIVISLLTGVGMAYLFKITSNQKRIREAKDRFKAHILEMRIYQDDLFSILRAFFSAIGSNFYYLRHSIKPILFIIVPVAIILIQMDARYSRGPLKTGDTTILTVSFVEGVDPFALNTSITPSSGILVDSRPVRISDPPEINWRLKALSDGMHEINLSAAGTLYMIPVVGQKRYQLIGHERRASSFWEPLFHPGLPAFPEGSKIAGVQIRYPSASHPLLSWRTHWIVVLLFYSLLGALISKFLLKVEI